jgi:molybdopterin/thiamine biosynthesis adenylyltransferase
VTDPAWWLEEPGARRAVEEDALDAAGLPWRLVEPAYIGGFYGVDVDVPGLDGTPVTMRAVYPQLFPYFPPIVSGSQLGLTHHWTPRTGLLCLHEPSGRGWHPDDTLAFLLTEQWSRVLRTNSGELVDDDGNLLETPQAEPWTAYLPVDPAWLAFTDSSLASPPGAGSGPALFRLDLIRGPQQRLHLTAVAVAGGTVPEVSPPQVFDQKHQSLVTGVWVKVEDVNQTMDAEGLLDAARRMAPGIDAEGWARVPSGGPWSGHGRQQIQLLALDVPVETGHRSDGRGWIVLARTRAGVGKPPGKAKIVKVEYAGHSDHFTRAPELRPLKDRSLVLVGGGGLGSEVHAMLAELGLKKLVVVDGDTVEAATAIRMRGAHRFAGLPKSVALTNLALETQPHTQVGQIHLNLGLVDSAGAEQLMSAIAEADLVVDCTANPNVQNLLASTLRAAGKPFVFSEAMPGVFSGRIAVIPPQADGCWECVERLLSDLPPQPASSGPDVVHPGCLEPTYPGTGYDLSALAAQSVASVVEELLTPASQSRVEMVSFRGPDGSRILPAWSSHSVPEHAHCAGHA